MKFPFGKKDTATAAKPAVSPEKSPEQKSPAVPDKKKPELAAGKPQKTAASDSRKQIIVGLGFIAAAFLGAVFLMYVSVNAQSAKESELNDTTRKLSRVKSENEQAMGRIETLQSERGRVMDLEKIVKTSEEIHGDKEAARKEGSLWINRKTGNCLVTLGILNGVTKGSRLGVFEGKVKIATFSVTSALDVVSYAEPVDKKIEDFSKDYYQVKVQ